MIESIGYTSDGQVWIRMVLDVNGEKMTGTLMMKAAFAREIAGKLVEAASKAEVTNHVGNSADVN
jgi:hypothetical protein